MAIFFITPKYFNVLLYTKLIVFSVNVAFPPCAYSQNFISETLKNNSPVFFKLEKIVDKLMKLEKKGDVNKMIDLMFNVKDEVEKSTGISISLKDKLNQVQKSFKKQGNKIPKSQFDDLQKKILKAEKKKKEKKNNISFSFGSNNQRFSNNQRNELSNDKFVMCSMSKNDKNKDHKDKNKEDQNEVCVPITVAFGITVALCGVFIICLPFPSAQVWGKYLIEFGGGIAIHGGLSHVEKEEEKKGNRSYNDK